MNRKRFTELLRALSRQGWNTLLIAFLLYISPILLFISIADEVRENETTSYDEAILRSVYHLKSDQLDSAIPILTDVGGVIGVAVITLAIVAVLLYRRAVRSALFVLVAVGGTTVLNMLVKLIFQRDRPQLWVRLVTENSYSFPSGHAMASSAIAFSLIALFWHTRYRWLITVASLSYLFFVAFTRLYLGVHYPTDIVAGWALSAAWVAVTYVVIVSRKRIKT